MLRLSRKQVIARAGLRFTEHKGRNKQAKTHNMTIPPELQQAIDAYDATAEGKVRHVSGIYLLTEAGIPFSTKGFSNRWRKWCDDAGVPQCTSHSLRKWGATTMAERGATDWQMAAFLGHTNTKQAANYTKKANRDRLTAAAIPLLGTRAAAE